MTWSDEDGITVVTKNTVVGFSSFASTPVEDFRVESGGQEILSAVKTENRLFFFGLYRRCVLHRHIT